MIIERLKTFVEGLSFTSRVLTVSNDGTNTTIAVENVYWSRKDLTVSVDGTDYTVVSVDCPTNTLVVAGVIVSPVLLTMKPMYFIHGTFRKVNGELNEILEINEKVPMFYVHEVLDEVYPPITEGLAVTAKVRAFVMDKAPENGDTTANQYTNIIQPLSTFFTQGFVQGLDSGKGIARRSTNVNKQNKVEWGSYEDSRGNMKRVIDAQLTGYMLVFDFPILRC